MLMYLDLTRLNGSKFMARENIDRSTTLRCFGPPAGLEGRA